MPVPLLRSIHQDSGVSMDKLEQYWSEAKDSARREGKKEGSDDFYAYVVGIVKRRAGISEETRIGKVLKDILNESK